MDFVHISISQVAKLQSFYFICVRPSRKIAYPVFGTLDCFLLICLINIRQKPKCSLCKIFYPYSPIKVDPTVIS